MYVCLNKYFISDYTGDKVYDSNGINLCIRDELHKVFSLLLLEKVQKKIRFH
jgi:hypothetical protein